MKDSSVDKSKILIALAMGMFVSALDQTIMTTASLTISHYFGAVKDQSWLFTSYLATSLVTIPIYGRMSDLFGRRRLFNIALILFGLGSLMGSLAPSFSLVILARLIQGLGAGGLFSLAFAIIADTFPIAERGKITLYFVLVFGGASLIGPLFGGVITNQEAILGIQGWRWIFIFNIPLIVCSVFFSTRYISSKRHKTATKFDGFGIGLFSLFIGSSIALVALSSKWDLSGIMGLASVLVLSLVFLFLIEKKMENDALFPLSYFSNRRFLSILLTSATANGAVLVALTINPMSLQIVQDFRPDLAGAILISMGVGNLFGSAYFNRSLQRDTGQPLERFRNIGHISLCLGYLAMLTGNHPASIALGELFIGVGAGLINQFTSISAPTALGAENRGSASGINTLFRQLGGVFGVSIAMGVLFSLWKTPVDFELNSVSTASKLLYESAEQKVFLIATISIVILGFFTTKMGEK